MRVLVACAFSGITRDEFIKRGHDAWECDLLPTERAGPHFQGDVWSRLGPMTQEWDLIIAHPPCTHLAVSGARWFKGKEREQDEAVAFARRFHQQPTRVAVENPISVLSTRWRKPDQIIQPWQFWDGEPGKGEVKATCLWLKNLPLLVPTTPNEKGRIARVHREPPSPDRWKARSRTYPGIAAAMAEQWGSL